MQADHWPHEPSHIFLIVTLYFEVHTVRYRDFELLLTSKATARPMLFVGYTTHICILVWEIDSLVRKLIGFLCEERNISRQMDCTVFVCMNELWKWHRPPPPPPPLLASSGGTGFSYVLTAIGQRTFDFFFFFSSFSISFFLSLFFFSFVTIERNQRENMLFTIIFSAEI